MAGIPAILRRSLALANVAAGRHRSLVGAGHSCACDHLGREALQHLPLILQGAKPPRYSVLYGGIDTFNALMTDRKKDLPFREVLRQQQETHRRLIAFLERAPEEQLRSGTRFRRRLRLDTYGHYPIHAAAIRKWRASRGPGRSLPG